MENIKDDHGDGLAGLNYFNYFTEVEEEFVRRRGKPMLISPMDWALVESWKNAGIPLHIVLRAINQAFDAYDKRAPKYRKVNSMFYCQQEVEATFGEYRLAQVGGAPASESAEHDRDKSATTREAPAFPREVILEFLNRGDDELHAASSHASSEGQSEIEDAINRALARLKEVIAEVQGSARVNAEVLERDLDGVDRMIMQSVTRACSEDAIQEIRAEAESQLRGYRKKMDKAIYEQTVQNFIARRLREINHIPRLSLFYL